MASEEQAEEMEVLASIFPDEYEVIEEPSGQPSFRIKLEPSPEESENHVGVYLKAIFPPEYPADVPPQLSLTAIKGLSEQQLDEVKEVADNAAMENIGGPSIFAVAEAVKEWLSDNNVAGQDGSMYSDMMRRMQQKDNEIKKQSEKAAIAKAADAELNATEEVDPEELERIRKRQAGHAVTLETFMTWKAAFDQEMLEKEIEKQRERYRSGVGSSDAAVANQKIGAVGEAFTTTASPPGMPQLYLDPATGIIRTVDETKLTGKQFFLKGGTGASDEDEEALIAVGEAEDMTMTTGNSEVAEEEEDDDDDEDYVPSDEEDDDR